MRIVRLRARGRVQGVGYRLWAVETATGLGLRGWVRNRVDGTVEMLLAGEDDAVAAMIEAARLGPRGARVIEMCVSDAADDASGGFTARPTE
jgi:acylphosphatase